MVPACGFRHYLDGDTLLYSLSTATPTELPSTAGNCDFESEDDPLCGYEQDTKYSTSKWGYHYTKDDFDWTRNKGNTTSDNTGPSVDHTLNSAEGNL